MDLGKIIDNLADRSKEASVGTGDESNDYMKDGLSYCGNCHTAKQCRIQVFGEERIVYCLCDCAKKKRDEEEAEYRRQERMMKIQKMRYAGFSDSAMQYWNFGSDDGSNPEITKIAKKYVENFGEMKKRGKGLLLFGNVGTGKTFMAACIANALIDLGKPCLVTNFARLINTIQDKYSDRQEYIDSLDQYDLLVIDDLASERDTEYMNEIVQNIIDSRYRAKLPLIVTTNLTSEELKHPADIRKQRIYSRLYEMCVPVEVHGKDRRRTKLIKEYDEMKNLLGIDVAERNE